MADVVVQQPIRSVYKDGSIVVSNVKSKVDNSTTSYSVVNAWYDGSPMDDSKVDQWGVYSKYKDTGEYLRENKPQWGELFLEVDTVDQLRAMSNYNRFLVLIRYFKGVRLSGYYVKGDLPRPVEYLLSNSGLSDDGGSIFQIGQIKLEHKFSEISFINYGIKGGDQNIDDSINLKKLFAYASANKVNVVNAEGEYFLKEERAIPVKVNVDFGKSVFHLYEEYDNAFNGRFDVLPDNPYVNVVLPAGFIDQLNSGSTYIDFLSQYKNHYFIIENQNQFINRTAGSGGKYYYTELFYVGDNGTVMSEISGILNGYTSCRAYPCGEDYIGLKGGIFKLNCKTSVSGYKLSGFNCTRSRVKFSDQIVQYEDGVDYKNNLSPDLGFHYFLRCYDVSMSAIKSVSRANEGSAGTYGLGIRYTTKIDLYNVNTSFGDNAWGYMGGLHVKDLSVSKSTISRVDVHYSAYNVSIKDSFINQIALAGGGLLYIRNTTVRGNVYLPFRQDYGAVWDGNISIINGTLINNSTNRARILNYEYGDVDYGMSQNLSLCKSLKIDGFTYKHTGTTGVRLNVIDVTLSKLITSGNNRVAFPTSVELKNMISINNDGFCPLALSNFIGGYVSRNGGIIDGALKTNVVFKIDNVDLSTQYNSVDHQNNLEQTTPDSVYPKFEFKNCVNIKINTASLLCEILINGCIINSYRSINANSRHTIANSTIALNRRTEDVAVSFTVTSLNTRFINCIWDTPKLNGTKVSSLSDINGILGSSTIQFGLINSEVVARNHLNSSLSSDLLAKLSAVTATPSSFMTKRLGITRSGDVNPILRDIGTTALRPPAPPAWFEYFDTSVGKPIWWNGSAWTVNQAAAQANSSATDIATMVQDFNALLVKLRAAGIISNI